MYSILIKNGEKSYIYALNDDGSVFRGDSDAVRERLAGLAESHPLGRLSVVHNVTLGADFSIEDVE